MRQLIRVSAWVALSACLAPAMAQDRIYRCGNEYTNNASIAKQRNCQLVEGGHVTVVHSGGRSADKSSSPPTASSSSNSAERSQARVDADQQKARDRDARAILQAELKKAQQKLQALQEEFNDGNPNKTALELRNPQAFNDRLEALQADIARQQSDVAGIERELARLPGS